MNLTLTADSALQGSYQPAGDKSLSHRAALFAALATGKSTIRRFLISGVTEAMLTALRTLGIQWELSEDAVLTVEGKGLHGFQSSNDVIYCGHSATTFRLLAGAIAGSGISCTLSGSQGLCRRPMDRIISPLKQMGCIITDTNERAPLTFFEKKALNAIHYALPVASAQVKSCLILAALSANGPTTLLEPGPSRNHTEHMLTSMGVKIDIHASTNRVTIHPPTVPLYPLNITLAGDISSATFLLIAAAITPGSSYTIKQVGINPTRTGIIDALCAMGARISFSNETYMAGEPVADISITYAPLHGITLQGNIIVRMIDEFPAFMIAAASATGTTIVRDAQELRHKESDRLAIMCAGLKRLGANITETPDGFTMKGTLLHGAIIDASGDHRIAMSFLLAGLITTDPVTVTHAEIITESFPDFTDVLAEAGALIKETI